MARVPYSNDQGGDSVESLTNEQITVATTKVKLTAGSTSLEVIPTAIECKGLVKLAAGLEFLDGTSMTTAAASGGGSSSTVAFRAYHNAHESPSSDQIEWKFESFDEGSNFSVGSGNGVFTAPDTGFYFFTLRSMCNVNDNTSLNLVLKVNGTLKSQATIRQPMFDETGQGYGELNTLLSLAANDEVTAHFDGSNFTALLNAEVNAEFSGFKV